MMSTPTNQQQTTPPSHQFVADKPPIPPRGAPPQVPQRQSSYESMNANVQLRQKSLNGNGKCIKAKRTKRFTYRLNFR